MPSKLDDTSSLHFLYACLESGQPKRIDIQEVAKEFGLSVPAARMRYRRLQSSLGDKQNDNARVTKPKSDAVIRKAQRIGKKKSEKEGLEMKWRGAEDGDDGNDDDEEDVAVGKVEDRAGGKTKKEETVYEEAAWKTLPETIVTGSSNVEGQAQATILPPPYVSPYLGSLQAQPQATLRHTPVPTLVEGQGDFLDAPDGYVYSSTHVAMPKTVDDQANAAEYQSGSLQYEPDQQFHWVE
jgi:hypothetical protein